MILDEKTQALLQRVARSMEESELRVAQSQEIIQRSRDAAARCLREDESVSSHGADGDRCSNEAPPLMTWHGVRNPAGREHSNDSHTSG